MAGAGLLWDPDEAVLALVFLLPLGCVLLELPSWLEYQVRYADVESAVDEVYNDHGGSSFAWLPPLLRPAAIWRRILGVFGITRSDGELEATLSALLTRQRAGGARLQAEMALRQRDREENAKALMTAVHTMRTVATAHRGTQQDELIALEQAVLNATSELQRERDERLASQRARAERELAARLDSERKHGAQDRTEAVGATMAAIRTISAAELRKLEEEAQRSAAQGRIAIADARAQLERAGRQATLADEETARLRAQLHAQQSTKLSGAQGAQAANWDAERAVLLQRAQEAQDRAERTSAEAERLRAQLGGRPSAAGGAELLQLEEELRVAREQLDDAAARREELSAHLGEMHAWIASQQGGSWGSPPEMKASSTAGRQSRRSTTRRPSGLRTVASEADGASAWKEAAEALAHEGKRAVDEPVQKEPASRFSSAGVALSTAQLWQSCQQWRRVDASEGFCAAGSRAAVAVTSLFAAELTQLDRSVEEEVCAWDYREFNYCWQHAAVEAPVTDKAGTAATAVGGSGAGAALTRDFGHGGKTLKDFCAAPEAVRAQLTAVEVLVLRLVTGKLGGVLQAALLRGTAASLRPWATTLACLVSALLKLIDSQAADAAHAYLLVVEKSKPFFDGAAGGVLSRGMLSITADPWVAREAAGEQGRRGLALLRGGLGSAADIGWVSQFPQQCERLLPPGTVLQPLAVSSQHPTIAATHGVRCIEASIERYTQPQPFSTFFAPTPPTTELITGLSVPGCAAAVRWAVSTFRVSADGLAASTELALPAGTELAHDGARLLGLLCGRASREACPHLEELCLRGASLAPAALQKLIEGLSGGHEGGEHELTLDMHGALHGALAKDGSNAVTAGEAVSTLMQHAPYVTELDVGGAPFGAAGVMPIARALGDNKTLSHLGIAAVGLGPGLDAAKRLAAALRQNGDLVSLDVRHNGLTTEGLRLLRSAAASRPRSVGGMREPLDVRWEPQAPLPTGAVLARSPRDNEPGALGVSNQLSA